LNLTPVIRRASPDDAAALSLVGRATLLETYAHMVPVTDLIAFAWNGHSEEDYRGFVERHCAAWIAAVPSTGAPIGYALLTDPDLPMEIGATDIELRRIYILSKFHGGGLGRKLFETTTAHARELGMKRMLIGVNAENEKAIAFYRYMGAAKVGTRRFQVGSTLFDDLILGVTL